MKVLLRFILLPANPDVSQTRASGDTRSDMKLRSCVSNIPSLAYHLDQFGRYKEPGYWDPLLTLDRY